MSVVGTWNSSFSQVENDWKAALLAMREGMLNLKPLITHRFSLEDYEKAFQLMHERKEMYCKVMFVNG